MIAAPPGEPAPTRPSAPQRPVAGVGGVVVRDDGVVLVRRGHAPLAGEWTIPGGRVELGETLVDAVRREIAEETGLIVEVGPVIAALDRIHRDETGAVLFHFVIVDYVCRQRGGTLRAGSDASDVAVVAAADLDRYAVATRSARSMTRRASGATA